MPYKNKEDKHANARFHYNKNKTEKLCSLEGCEKPLPTNRNKFCSDTCSNKHFADKTRIAKQIKRARESIVRHCAYVECKKELPKTAHAQKRYCPGTDCYYKQNQLDQAKKRAEKKENKVIKFDTCQNDNCDETFEHHPRKKYCTTECRKDQNIIDSEKKRLESVAIYNQTKAEAKRLTGSAKNIKISSLLGVRMSRKPRKQKPFKIEHFSAQWLEDLWNKRAV